MTIFAGGLIAVSCSLTTVPEDSLVPDSYFRSAASHEQWLNSCYSQLPEYTIYEMEGDDVIDKMPAPFFARTLHPSVQTWDWSMLRHINYYMEHADICEDRQAVSYYKSLARFHRAYFYFSMVRQWGDIMWYDRVIGSTDAELLYKERDDRAFVVRKIIADLDAAVEGLAGTEKNELSANVTEWAALAFKARVCLFEGTFRKYHDLDDWEFFLEQAADAAGAVMRSGKFSLYSEGSLPYRDAFFMTTYPACEAILCRAYSSSLSMNHTLDRDIPAAATGFTQRFVNHYLMKDGSRVTSVPDYDKMTFKETFSGRDPRMAQTVWGPGACDMYGNTGTDAFNMRSLTGYFPLKFMRDIGRSSAMNINAVVIRYPEVLLAYAEAKAELGTLTAADIRNTVDVIRARAGIPAMDLAASIADPDMLLDSYYPNVRRKNPSSYGAILEIRRERTVELVMEGHRQWDIIRWREGASIDNAKNPFYGVWFPGPGEYDLSGDSVADVELYIDSPSENAPVQLKIGEDIFLSGCFETPAVYSGNVVALSTLNYVFDEDRDYLWPVPAAQRTLCGGRLTQNPGWDDGVDF